MRAPYIHIGILIAFVFNILGMPVQAQENFRLPAPGVMVHLSPEFSPATLKGMTIHPENPFKFDFILDKGEDSPQLEEAARLIKYFLASMTTPQQDLWVNLSPYEKNRIIPNSFGQTQMGRDLLAEDYILKQITASLIYPEGETGKKFWERVYSQAAKRYGTTDIPVNTFNKVWIVPDHAKVYEHGNTAFVVHARLKVMLEEDYLSLSKHQGQPIPNDTHALASQIVRELIIPQLENEVNTAKNFAPLRQVYHALILAVWYKKRMKNSILGRKYMDQNKMEGIATDTDTQAIYQRYLKAFKKGVYNYIKEESDPMTHAMIPRKYFSGGFNMGNAMRTTEIDTILTAQDKRAIPDFAQLVGLKVDLTADNAMAASKYSNRNYKNTRSSKSGTISKFVKKIMPVTLLVLAVIFEFMYLQSLNEVPHKTMMHNMKTHEQVMSGQITERMMLLKAKEGKYWTDAVVYGDCVVAVVIDKNNQATAVHFFNEDANDIRNQVKFLLEELNITDMKEFLNLNINLFNMKSEILNKLKYELDSRGIKTKVYNVTIPRYDFNLSIEKRNEGWVVSIGDYSDRRPIPLFDNTYAVFKQKGPTFVKSKDKSMTSSLPTNNINPLGGIDLTDERMKLEVDADKAAHSLPIDLKAMENIEINGLYIKNIEIKPLNDLPEMLGIAH